MFPRKFFTKKYFTGKYWPPAGTIVEYILHPIKFFYRTIVQTLYNEAIVEQTFACEGIQTNFTATKMQTTFMDAKINTPIKAEKRTVVFYDCRPVRS